MQKLNYEIKVKSPHANKSFDIESTNKINAMRQMINKHSNDLKEAEVIEINEKEQA